MSKNIVIQKAGIAQNLTVDALRLKKQGGGTEDWVPADGKNLVALQIGGSGTYKASDYNAYGIAVARVTPKYGGGATSKAAEHDFTEKHTPSIKEGNKSRNFSAAMLKTNLQGGGTCLWIPRMDVELKSKYITKSGTYAAEADDCYGFDQVTVSGVDVEITQDDDGDDVAEITDGGTTTEQKLPSSIVVDVPPTKTVYSDGQAIDYTGMVVKAYTRSGQLWTDASHPNGIIPISELTLPVTIAHADQGGGASSDLDTGSFSQPIPLSGAATFAYSVTDGTVRHTYTWTPINGAVMVIRQNTERRSIFLWASETQGDVGQERHVYINEQTGEQYTYYSRDSTNLSYTANGKIVYYIRLTAGHVMSGKDILVNPVITGYGDDAHDGPAAWTAVYGEISGGTQAVPVQWNRPYDSELLETSFSITVA